MELTKLQAWLSTFPGLQKAEWALDCLPHKPGMATLISKGIEVLDSMEDVLGNRKQTLKLTCQLAFSGLEEAQVLLELQHWVLAQGNLPRQGNGKQSVSLLQGRHLTKNKLGLSVYTAQLEITYEQYYEVNENGEN